VPAPIRDNPALSRFELDAGGVMAFMNYRLAGGVMSLDHTETPRQARGRGIASQLVEGVLEVARAQGGAALPVRERLFGQASGVRRSRGVTCAHHNRHHRASPAYGAEAPSARRRPGGPC
jgi:GNAT superfamily N-acetyltransferase